MLYRIKTIYSKEEVYFHRSLSWAEMYKKNI